MSAYIIWVDQQEAKWFEMTANGINKGVMKKKSHEHSGGHVDARHHQQDEHFYHEIAEKLSPATEILLTGPGLAKVHFKTHLEKHHHEKLANKIVGVETVDHPSEGELLKLGRDFFKNYDLFHS